MKLVFATNNANKLAEIKQLLPEHIELLSLKDIGCTEEIPETENTIEGNAWLKAKYVKEKYGYDCFADDTGLEVKALNGAPGVLSARYAGEPKNNQANIAKLLGELTDKEDRRAQFKTVIALYFDGAQKDFTGICPGQIINELRGEGGFGYDPIFVPQHKSQTFAEMTAENKNLISHRALAFKQLLNYLNTN
ncbi:non-canonical purine NTP diphosphatase [uncultured Mesonia sp.]|uniref:non-canonical purine NTP diphosphatase n=1 Tax=uncultured Mesonia sp. TaxID=399731 RepID=UPI00374F04BC